MNKFLIKILFVYLLYVPCLFQAEVIETSNIADILSEIDSHTIVFFDIDDTLINTKMILGNTPWWYYFEHHVSNAPIKEKHLPEIYTTIQKILQHVPMELIEPHTSQMIKNLQQNGILAFALTARAKSDNYMDQADYVAYQHLGSVDIDFTRTILQIGVDPHTAQFFSYGIIFTGYQKKGPFLKSFLENLDLHPHKIVFVDDNKKQMESVESVVKSMGIPFKGFRYNKLDKFHEKFDPLIANIQLEALLTCDLLLSDEAAKKIAKSNSHVPTDYFLDFLIQKWSTP